MRRDGGAGADDDSGEILRIGEDAEIGAAGDGEEMPLTVDVDGRCADG